MDTLFPAGEITAKPPAIAEALKSNAAVLTADAVVVADSFGVFTYLHSAILARLRDLIISTAPLQFCRVNTP
jgi:hypothetical protein